jgi:large subunit ribosomal protein L9
MKVILKEDIANLGELGAVVKVADGYARNYLIPQGKAVLATPENTKQLEQQIKSLESRRDAKLEEAQNLAARLGEVELSVARKVVDEVKLYGSVTQKDISEALEEKGFEIEKKAILLKEAIRELGDFEVEVRVHPQVEVAIKVKVVEDK